MANLIILNRPQPLLSATSAAPTAAAPNKNLMSNVFKPDKPRCIPKRRGFESTVGCLAINDSRISINAKTEIKIKNL